MTNWLAGMRITADRLNDNTLKESTTSGLVPASGFTVNSFSGRKVNGFTTVHVYLLRTGGDIPTSGYVIGDNLADTAMATLPSGWRPPELINAIIGDGNTDGEVIISAAGVITLRSQFNKVVTDRNFRITAGWISGNS